MKHYSNSKSKRCYFLDHHSWLAKYGSVLLALAVLNLSISCSYFTVRNVPTTEETILKDIERFNTTEKYVIIHSDSSTWHLENMVLNDDEQLISGVIQSVDDSHMYNKERDEKRVHRFSSVKNNPFDEVHFYLKTPSKYHVGDAIEIPLSDITKLSYNDKNTGRSVVNALVGTIGSAFVISLIAAALKGSCPFVYVKDGEEYRYVGELYPGVITPNMQRDDFLELPSYVLKNGTYTVKISNQLKEIQYTDQLQLLQVNHPLHSEVLIDSKGNFHTFQSISSPSAILNNNNRTKLEDVLEKDGSSYLFDDVELTKNSIRSVVFEFEKPKQIEQAKLYLTAKNSMWLDYVFGRFNAQFGDYYNTFQKKQQKLSKAELNKWSKAQNIPLSIYTKMNGTWELVEQIHTVGPLATRNFVVPIDLSATNSAPIQVKLETGFMFWELDYIGIDYSKNLEIQPHFYNPSLAIDKNGKDVTQLLSKHDEVYYVQPKIGDEVLVNFNTKSFNDSLSKTSLFLKSRGYYNYIRNYKGIPDREKLESFRDDAAFTRFSEKAYFDFINYATNKMSYNE